MFEHFTQIASGSGNYIVCPVCSYTMKDEGSCLRCEQDREYECSLNADGGSTTDNPVALTLDELRTFYRPKCYECNVDFKSINERGQLEPGAWVGVICEVFTLFRQEFSIAMTIGEREGVPFVRHDYFVGEWEAVVRILVKGYMSISYFATFFVKGISLLLPFW